MRVVVDVAGVDGQAKNKFEVVGFSCDSASTFIWALQRQLKAAQAVWPELKDAVVVDKFTQKEATGKEQ